MNLILINTRVAKCVLNNFKNRYTNNKNTFFMHLTIIKKKFLKWLVVISFIIQNSIIRELFSFRFQMFYNRYQSIIILYISVIFQLSSVRELFKF